MLERSVLTIVCDNCELVTCCVSYCSCNYSGTENKTYSSFMFFYRDYPADCAMFILKLLLELNDLTYSSNGVFHSTPSTALRQILRGSCARTHV